MKYIWLFGENLGRTMNNNSWYYFEHVVMQQEASNTVDYYFVADKKSVDRGFINGLPRKVRSKIVWRNSLRHHKLYWKSDMYFVTLSYKDILPDLYRGNHYNKQPLIYLQHGTVAIKKIGYSRDSYDNSIFKFITYSREEADLLVERNDFDRHQLKYLVAHPRYKRLIKMQDQFLERQSKDRQILWFLTWREYLQNGLASEGEFFEKIKSVLQDERLKRYLRENGIRLKLVLHQFFDGKLVSSAIGNDVDIYKTANAATADIMGDLVKSELLITDYSSIGFDFTFLRKPVLMYQFDSLIYSTNREFYVNIAGDLKRYTCRDANDLVLQIIRGEYNLNRFFANKLERNIDREAVMRGDHITELNNYLIDAQKNKISIFGYNFFGRGGTVAATKALAEGLAKKGYLVELISLKKLNTYPIFPGGVIVRSFMQPWRSVKESLKYRLFIKNSLLSYLNNDADSSRLIPYVGYALRRYLQKTKSRTVISTRETLHLFVHDTINPNIKNKLYFFHTAADAVNKLFPGILNKISERRIEKALFVTELSRRQYVKLLNYKNYQEYSITGNGIVGSEILRLDDIREVGKKDQYRGISLVRISKDRMRDVKNIIEYGIHLKNNHDKSIVIDIFGTGDYIFQFCDLIAENGLEDIISYKGLTQQPNIEIQQHDFLVDFSDSHTFGMIYIEAILNGVMCFAKSNQGSQEVLDGIDGSIYVDWVDLSKKIHKLYNIHPDQLRRNYEIISKRYNTERIASRVIKLID